MTDHGSSLPETQTKATRESRTVAPERSICDFESFEYHAEDNVYRAIYNHSEQPASAAVVSAVAAASDTDPLDMDPLHSTIDTDALNALATPRDVSNSDAHLTFEFHGHKVTISKFGRLKIRPPYSSDD